MGRKKFKNIKMGMAPTGGGFGMSEPVGLTSPQFISDLSKHIATKQVKRGIGKVVELARLKEDIIITNTIGPPEVMDQPLNKAELQQIAQRLYDLGYYYEKNPESDEIEFTLAPNYTGLLGEATSKEQDSLQAAIKRFQRVHGFSPDKCDGCIRLEGKTLKKLNSNLRTSLMSYNTSGLYKFESEKEDNHLHPILWNFLDEIEWFYKVFFIKHFLSKVKKKGMGKEIESKLNSNYATEIIISCASRGYPGDGHKNPESKYYEACALDIAAVNGKSVSDAPRQLELANVFASKTPPQVHQMFLEQLKTFNALIVGPVIGFAHILAKFKEDEDQIPIKWCITELDSPWHGDTENHQEDIHVSIGRKIHIGSD